VVVHAQNFKNQALQNYCSLHINRIEHNCNIVIEGQRASQYQSQPFSHTQLSPSVSSTSYQTDMGADVRGTTDGTYTWYRQEKEIPENAFDPDSGIEFKGILLSHKSELFHFLLASILIFIIGFITFYPIFFIYPWATFMLAGFYLTAFLFHEFGHRQAAIRFGLQTKFRLLTYGMLITGFSLVMGIVSMFTSSGTFPMLALPGAVVVLGLDKINRKTGICKAAGPFVNLCYGIILLVVSLLIPIFPLNYYIGMAAYFNFMLGAFNMIPFGILDGQNIWKWKKKVYISLIIPLLGLLILTLVFIYSPISPYIPG